jgi:hypothetical protein
MFAAKAMVGVVVPLSFLAGAGADRGLRVLGYGEQGAAAASKEAPMARESPAAREVRVVYSPSWSSSPQASAPPPVARLEETRAALSLDEGSGAAAKPFIDINSASIAELNQMGAGRIGKAIVRRLPYGSVEDLLRKRVLTRADYELVRDKIAAR